MTCHVEPLSNEVPAVRPQGIDNSLVDVTELMKPCLKREGEQAGKQKSPMSATLSIAPGFPENPHMASCRIELNPVRP